MFYGNVEIKSDSAVLNGLEVSKSGLQELHQAFKTLRGKDNSKLCVEGKTVIGRFTDYKLGLEIDSVYVDANDIILSTYLLSRGIKASDITHLLSIDAIGFYAFGDFLYLVEEDKDGSRLGEFSISSILSVGLWKPEGVDVAELRSSYRCSVATSLSEDLLGEQTRLEFMPRGIDKSVKSNIYILQGSYISFCMKESAYKKLLVALSEYSSGAKEV